MEAYLTVPDDSIWEKAEEKWNMRINQSRGLGNSVTLIANKLDRFHLCAQRSCKWTPVQKNEYDAIVDYVTESLTTIYPYRSLFIPSEFIKLNRSLYCNLAPINFGFKQERHILIPKTYRITYDNEGHYLPGTYINVWSFIGAIAIKNGIARVVQHLVELGFLCLNSQMIYHYNPFAFAYRVGTIKIAIYLLRHGSTPFDLCKKFMAERKVDAAMKLVSFTYNFLNEEGQKKMKDIVGLKDEDINTDWIPTHGTMEDPIEI